ncbi:MAG: gamma-glutamylcyclotransferase family protein [Ferruginibacter sp.]
MQQHNLFFLYGSLKLGFKDPNYQYLTQYFHYVGEATVPGKFYFNGSYPVAVSAEGDEKITGDVYELNDPDDFKWVAMQLDDYEGLNVEPGETAMYKRELVKIQLQNTTAMAWIYFFNRSIDNLSPLDADEVAKFIAQQKM